MKFIQTICLSLALMAGSPNLTVQAQKSAEYFLHTVTKGQSLYSIASMYNVSVDDIVRINPGNKELIREGQSLKIPQKSDNNSQQGQFHTIQAGETLYQLTVKYNITAEAICKANPGLSASNFRIGQVIVIPPQNSTEIAIQEEITKELAAAETPKKEWKDMHKVQRKETIFSISREYGITEEELIAANPELRTGKLKKGTFLFIPYPKQSESTATSDILSQGKTPSNEELFSKNSVAPKRYQTIRTALILPFSSSRAGASEEQSRMVALRVVLDSRAVKTGLSGRALNS